MSSETLAAARWYVRAGLSVIPVLCNGTKAPAPVRSHGETWKAYQARIATEDDLLRWWEDGQLGIGIVGGKVSGGLEILDFDDLAAYDEWISVCADHDLSNLVARIPRVDSPRGKHLYYRCPFPAGNTDLARTPDRHIRIQTRGEGGQCVAPGSPPEVHETGTAYTWGHLGADLIPLLTQEERGALWAMARFLDQYDDPEDHHAPVLRRILANGESGTVEDFNERGDLEPALIACGWRCTARRGSQSNWLRPGKEGRGCSATLGHAGVNRFHVFSSNAPLDPRSYDLFGAYARLLHAGDFKAATRKLYDEGYGKRIDPANRPGTKVNRFSDTSGDDVPEVMNGHEYGDFPSIETDGQLRWIADSGMAALRAKNDPPSVFVSLGRLARLEIEDGGRARPQMLDADSLTGIMTRVANWYKGEYKDTAPPERVMRMILAQGSWPGVPVLRGVVTSPVLSPSLRIVDTPGYDASSGLYYDCGGCEIPPCNMSIEGFEAARRLIFDDVLGDFPFKDQASRANAVAFMLLPLVRPAIKGATPMTVIDAPTAGTGKSKLAEIILSLYCPGGIPNRSCPPQEDQAEWKKSITSAIASRNLFFYLDNVAGKIKNDSLYSAITSTSWTDRILGGNREIDMPHSIMFVATANNILYDRELGRRTIWIRLDADMEHPELRTGFRHADITGWVKENRGRILSALLTIVQGWLDGGAEYGSVTMGSFEAYAALMSGLMSYACPGFLGNRDQQIEGADDNGPLHAFVAEWWDAYEAHKVCANELFMIAKRHFPAKVNETEAQQKMRLSRELKRHTDQVFDGRKIVSTGLGEARGIQYKVQTYQLRPL